jgi:homogentisate solanesyltransferase
MVVSGSFDGDAIGRKPRAFHHFGFQFHLLAMLIVMHKPDSVHGFTFSIHSPSTTISSHLCADDDRKDHRQHRSRIPVRSLTPLHNHENCYLSRNQGCIRAVAGSHLYSSSSVIEGDIDDGGGVESYGTIRSSSSKGKLLALYKFTRPHTIRGTILASICGTIRALRDTPYWYAMGATSGSAAAAVTSGSILNIVRNMLPRAFIGMIALLFGNAFIVGINQIYDQSIDKMNKPFLPIVSGEMNTATAWVIVTLSAIIGPILVYNNFPAILFQLYTFGLFLGLIYSVPPIRTKQNPILAGLTIACVRGLLLNFGIYYAVKDTFVRNSFTWSPHVSFIARFMTIFASIIAITKDLPDIEGDKANQIETFVTKFGIAKIAKGATGLLFINYIQAIVTGVIQRTIFAPLPMIGGHAVLASILLYRYKQLQPNSMPSVKRFYKHIWDLFYLEYVLYTLI